MRRPLALAAAAAILLASLAGGWQLAQRIWPPEVVYDAPVAAPGPAGAPGFICPAGTVGVDGVCTPDAPLEP